MFKVKLLKAAFYILFIGGFAIALGAIGAADNGAEFAACLRRAFFGLFASCVSLFLACAVDRLEGR